MRPAILVVFVFMMLLVRVSAQTEIKPVARFSFNYGSDRDEMSNRRATLKGINYTLDRFGNNNSAVFLSGNVNSYINLGSYKALKPNEGTISLWVSIENKSWAGKGTEYNPIILTKCTGLNDFYEAYAIYYMLKTERLVAVSTQDSINELGLFYLNHFERGRWYHLVLSYDKNYMCFYVDGKLEGKLPKNFETKFLEGDSVLLGSTGNEKNKRYLNALLDDIEFYNKVLSEHEIDELYHSPNPNRNKIILNYVLLGLVILVFVLLSALIIHAYVRKSIKKVKQRFELANKLLEDELRINRALMNPHFIFNSLNTLHNYILMNNTDKASDYLLKFSKLIRKILDSSLSETIRLELEIELLQRYLELESMRFKERIKYSIYVDPRIIPSVVNIPIMMIQPFVENSIWHGLQNKNGDKIIDIEFFLYAESYIKCCIDDNGTGRKNREKKDMEKKSLATGFIKNRIDLLNKIHGLNSNIGIIDKPEGSGTRVEIILPILKN